MTKCLVIATVPRHAISATPSENPPNDLQTAEEIATFLKVDPKTVFNWAKTGIIPEAFRVGKTVRFSLEAVKASLEINL
ncbi:MAG: helix-turn-helix domain-containing protein [Akkermansiaceae bacterium]